MILHYTSDFLTNQNVFDSNRTEFRLKEDRLVVKRALSHFDKKILDMFRDDKSITDKFLNAMNTIFLNQ